MVLLKKPYMKKERPKTTVSYFLEINESRILCPHSCDGTVLDLNLCMNL